MIRYAILFSLFFFFNSAEAQVSKAQADSFYREGALAFKGKDYAKAYYCLLTYKNSNTDKFSKSKKGDFYDEVNKAIAQCDSILHDKGAPFKSKKTIFYDKKTINKKEEIETEPDEKHVTRTKNIKKSDKKIDKIKVD